MTSLRALIVDDEANSREILADLLARHCPGLEVLGQAATVAAARNFLERDKPNLVFLDVKMPGESGFDLLETLVERRFAVVIVSAYSEYALRAIKAAAFDYLLKPIDYRELQATVRKLVSEVVNPGAGDLLTGDNVQKLDVLRSAMHRFGRPERIALPHARGLRFVSLADIVYLQAEYACTWVNLVGGERVLAKGLLREYEELFASGSFVRIHKSYLVNIDHVREYSYEKGGQAVLSSGVSLPVSRMRLRSVLDRLHGTTGDSRRRTA